jgi:DNA-binding MarR family transcriptional regulator
MSQVLTGQVSAQTAEIPPGLRAWTALLRAHASTTRLLSAQLQAEHGFTLNDYEALYLLSRAENQRLKRVDLARRLLLTPSGVTRLLEGLQDAGLVKPADCASDRRITYAQLTEAGGAKLEATSCGHVGSVLSLLEEHLAEDEIEALAGLLEKLPGGAADDGLCSAPGAQTSP